MSIGPAQIGSRLRSQPWRALLAAQVDPYRLLVLLLPFAVLAFYRSWIITTPGGLDPWYSLSYFVRLRESIQLTSGYYAATRLAYWLPGAAVHSLLPFLAANWVLRLAYWWLAVGALAGIIKQLCDRTTALVAAVLIGTYWHFLQEVGWSYVDGAGIAYYLAALWCITRAGSSKYRRRALFAAGICYAATMNTNLFLVTMAPLLAMYHLVLNRGRPTRRLLFDLLIFGLGWALATGLLNGTYFLLSGSVADFWTQLTAAWTIYHHQGPTTGLIGCEVPPLGQWLPQAHWLKLPFAVFLSSLVYLAAAIQVRALRLKPIILLQVLYVLQFAGMAYLQRHGRVLMLRFYASYLIPHMFLALSTQLFVATRALSRVQLVTVVLVIVGGFGGFLTFPLASRLAPFSRWVHTSALSGLVLAALFAVLCAAVFLMQERRRRARFTALVLMGSLVAALNAVFAEADARDGQYKKDSYAAICEGVRAIDAVRGPLNSLRFWYRLDENPNLYSSVHSAYLWGYTALGYQYPSLTEVAHAHVPTLAPPLILVLMSDHDRLFPEAQQILQRAGIASELVQEKSIRCGRVAYTITLLRIIDGNAAAGSHPAGRSEHPEPTPGS